MRLIDGDRLCNDLLDRWNMAEARKEELIKAIMADIVTPIVASQPTIEERKTGKWIAIKKGELGYSVGDFRCTACERPCPCYHLTPYCPNCGAKMEGKE